MFNFNVIIATTDLSDYSMRALPYAVGLAERFDATLKIVCVSEPELQTGIAFVGFDPVATEREHTAAVKDGLDQIVASLPKTIDIEAKVLESVAVDQIVAYAQEINADLIVSCTHGRTGLSHMLMGSTAEALVRRSPCPVLTLKQPMMVVAELHGA